MSPERCTITVKSAGRTAFIIIEGYLNATAPPPKAIARQIAAGKHRYVILDMQRASEMDKEGLRWLSGIRDELDALQLPLKVVVSENGKIRRILHLMQYDKFLSLMYSLFQAWRPSHRRIMRRRQQQKLSSAIVEQLEETPALASSRAKQVS